MFEAELNEIEAEFTIEFNQCRAIRTVENTKGDFSSVERLAEAIHSR
ncbi:hypothetical protein [Haladaptatus halobius]